jgi:hypothetical protein
MVARTPRTRYESFGSREKEQRWEFLDFALWPCNERKRTKEEWRVQVQADWFFKCEGFDGQRCKRDAVRSQVPRISSARKQFLAESLGFRLQQPQKQ